MNRLVFATRNAHKLRELNELVATLGYEAVALTAIAPDAPDVEETGSTFLENAALKAIAAYRQTGLPAIADDSGICVSALDNRPGIYSARYSGTPPDNERNNQLLLKELEGKSNRNAHYACALAMVVPRANLLPDTRDPALHEAWPDLPSNTILLEAYGTVHGEITHAPQGSGGFGYDPLFYIPSLEATFAEVDPAVKHGMSHRGKAFRSMVDLLSKYTK